jgi:RHS repeat-associated protein
VSGPAAVTFANASLPITTATFTVPGTYVLRLTANDSQFTASDDVTITVNPYPCITPPPGLVSWWPGDGNYQELVSANNGNPPTGATFPTGMVAQAFGFDGTSISGFSVPDAKSLRFTSAISIAAWVNPSNLSCNNVDNSGYCAIVAKDNRVQRNYGLWMKPDGGLHLSYVNGTNIFLESPPSIVTNQYSFVTGIIDPAHGVMQIYVNGVLRASRQTTAPMLANTLPVTIGVSPGGFNFRGQIDEVNLYNRPLTPQEMLDIFNAKNGGLCKDQVNHPPAVNAGPDQTIGIRDTATLQGTSTDDGRPTGSTLTTSWSVVSGPGTVTFENPQQASTTATFSLPGTYVLRLTGSDSDLISDDDVTVTVNPSAGNQPPTVSAGANQTIQIENAATLNGSATDDGLPAGSTLTITWSVVSGPGQVVFANSHQAATTATFSTPGTYLLRLTASDTELTRFADVTITVKPTNHAPVVSAGPDLVITLPGTATLNGTATDDGLPAGSTLSVLWSVVSGPGQVGFNPVNRAASIASFNTAGTYVLRITAKDSELTTTDDVTVEVKPPAPPAVVSINSPVDGSTITNRTNFIGSVSAGASWTLEYSLNTDAGSAAQVWTTIASGSTAVTNGLLGTFDPTVLVNGIYTVRLRAVNAGGQVSESSVSAVVTGDLKLGNFSLSFSDLNVPVAGLPIQVTRTYDSRDPRTGDFGAGWQLGVSNVRVEKSVVLGANWDESVTQGFLPTYCIQPTRAPLVTVTFPDNRVFKFQASLGSQCQLIAPFEFSTVSFNQVESSAGTAGARLVAIDDSDVFITGEAPGNVELISAETVDVYNPTRFQLTTGDGTTYIVDEKAGLQSLRDLNNNTLTITPQGIIHSSGKSVVFTRDSLGRITQITDPLGNAMTYTYDANGDLVSFRDRENQISTFTYNAGHHMLSMVDPRGKQPVRIEYDDQGRVVRQIDADGKIITISHDVNGRREVTTDRLGHTSILEYNDRGMVVRTTDSEGNVTSRAYDSRDNVLSSTNALGKTTTYTYDAHSNKLSETDPLGNLTRYTYNSRDQVLTVTDALNRVTTKTYDANGNLLTVTDPLNQTTTNTYNSRGLLETRTDPLGNVSRFEYDTSGNLAKETDPLGNVKTYTYDVNNNKLTQSVNWTNAAGVAEVLVTTYQYDKVGQLVKTINPDSSFTENVYDSVGKQIATRDQLGRQVDYTYDDLGRLVRLNFPDSTTQESTFDDEGHLLTLKDRANHTSSYTYDSLGRLLKTTNPDGTFTSKTYDAIGRVTTEKDEKGGTTTYEYDPNCGCPYRRAKVIDALNNATAYTYDAVGNIATMTDARNNVTRYEYDGNNRRTRTVYPDNTVEVTTYDGAGRVSSKTDQAGQVTRFEYDKMGRLTKVIDAASKTTTYTYDEVGNMLTQVDANNRTTRFEYDRVGRRTKRTLPLGMSETFVYDAIGNVKSRTNFKGETTTYDYNLMNKLIRKTPDPALNQPAIVLTYEPTGQRATMTDASGTTTYTYDLRDRLLTKVTPQGTLTYTYGPTGNLRSMTSSNANGVSVTYTEDALNRLATVKDNHQPGTTSYNYDANGNLAGYTYPNGVQTTTTYNSLNRLTNVSVSKGAPIASYAYTLGAAGNRLTVSELSGRQVTYNYDNVYRLTKETVSGDASSNGVVDYVYDNVGNRLSRTSTMPGVPSATYAYDANDRLDSETYDANGNLKVSGGGSYNYTFEDRLSEANGGAVTFTYDGDGNRVAKTVGGVTTKYLVDTANPTGYAQVVEESVNGAVQREYVFGHDLISQRQFIGGNWTTSYFGYDGNGSVRFLTNASGAITDTYNYDAFGAIVSSTGSTPNDYLFAGEQFDANLGFYYLRARYMNPFNGRFVTRDTYEGSVFDPSTLHKYLYVANDPVNKIDPSGLQMLEELEEVAEVQSEVLIPMEAKEAAEAIEIGKLIRFMITALGIGAVAVTEYELRRRREKPIRLNHYTDYKGLAFIEAPGGMIASPSGTNFYSPDIVPDAATAEDQFAVCHKLDIRIALDMYIEMDGFYWPPTTVQAKTCGSDAKDGWAGKYANGGKSETSTMVPVPFATRNPITTPLLPRQ